MATVRKQRKRPAPNGEEVEEDQGGAAPHARTRSIASGGKNSKKQRKATAPTATATNEGSSPLLDLPAELRNQVYEYVAIDAGASLHPRTRGKLASKTSLCRVSRQVREEYQAVLYISAPIIEAYVTNFKFAHIVTFLNKLSARELNALPTLNIPTHRRLRVHLEVRRGCPKNPEDLHKWVVRCQHPTKKGTQIKAHYKISRSVHHDMTCAWRIHQQLRQKLALLEGLEGGKEDRLYTELAKVDWAMMTI
ncbi:hypothetical protein LTR36_000906 [Oleoguttula mirabilis]|uniref:F-box domain-containing protein n=1 Tax=Oleoguttula mirabilis TaxID=1507867 RepID=A0AAV9JQJ6_9PEZI|nr:hypothetical protein LTR36_000906 [Oleoguttula mirabilis]